MNSLLKKWYNYFIRYTRMYNGALIDTRSDVEKAGSWKVSEVYAQGAPQFRTVGENEWKKYLIRNQGRSGSCVANSQAKFIEIMKYLKTGDDTKFSHAPVYQKRVNRPKSGMGFPDAPRLQISINSAREEIIPSENMSDAELDSIILPQNYEDMNDEVKPTDYIEFAPRSFDDVASYVENNGAAIIWVISDYIHWNQDVPEVGGKQKGEVRHSVCVVDAVTFNGVKYLVIEDSWGTFGKYNGQRLITKEFFDDAVFMAYALTVFEYEENDTSFTPFNVRMEYGQTSGEIIRLQDYLRSKGFFPKNTTSTGYYGNITAKAVLAFQITHKVDSLSTLYLLKGRWVGNKTLAKINQNL